MAAAKCTSCGRPAGSHPGGDRLSLAVRTAVARRSSTCPSCHGPITVGQGIARLTDPPAWVHVACVPAVASVLATWTRSAGISA